jgi:hypothetical protein
MDAYDWHRRSPDFDWRRVLADLGLPRPDAPPGRLVRAGVKLGWLAAKPLRSTQ